MVKELVAVTSIPLQIQPPTVLPIGRCLINGQMVPVRVINDTGLLSVFEVFKWEGNFIFLRDDYVVKRIASILKPEWLPGFLAAFEKIQQNCRNNKINFIPHQFVSAGDGYWTMCARMSYSLAPKTWSDIININQLHPSVQNVLFWAAETVKKFAEKGEMLVQGFSPDSVMVDSQGVPFVTKLIASEERRIDLEDQLYACIQRWAQGNPVVFDLFIEKLSPEMQREMLRQYWQEEPRSPTHARVQTRPDFFKSIVKSLLKEEQGEAIALYQQRCSQA